MAVHDFFFNPDSITVPVGTTVTWIGVGIDLHTVTSYDDIWNSDIGLGESFSYTFNEPGTYTYYCIPHESLDMTGKVIVE